ncbi:Vinorine synthase [Handroanthus impetiginosus]|uniref:Vinorine synthase n=1 Tax=Handroanthus impetiginosus TaxID=429701 RepID=A0A2G9H990_9LAMI|nr:Vinorine synthase [Handroanthus impetiginosus]
MNNSSNVQIISKELIKPSSPAPDHLKTLKLSLLDQLSPPVYISLIFFYEADELKCTTGHTQISQHLKQSLSKTLTLFYPLAGKIDTVNFTVDCDDNGVEFIEARAHSRLRDVTKDLQLDQLRQYLPVDPLGGIYVSEGTPFMVQVNFFDCGGIAVAACVSHLIADGWSLVEFMNAWAATCRGEKSKFTPEFGVLARYLPARDLSGSNISPTLLMGNEKLVTKRFVFDKEKLEALKEAATHEVPGADIVKNPTRVEVVSAFIWKHFKESKAKKNITAAHIVNIRSRASPSLQLENALGKAYFVTTASNEGSVSIPQLMSKLRRAIRTIDDEYIRETHSEYRYLSDISKYVDVLLDGEELILFSSWCRFPMYEVDFGWGVPSRVCTTALLLNNCVILMSTRSGDGIEAWINLLPDDIESFENKFKAIGKTSFLE